MDLHDFSTRTAIYLKVFNSPALLSHTLKSGCIDNLLKVLPEN